MYILERLYDAYRGQDKETIIAETKADLIDELTDLFYGWYEASYYTEEEGIIAIKEDDWEEGEWYDWKFDMDYLSSLSGEAIVRFFDTLSSVESFTLLYSKE